VRRLRSILLAQELPSYSVAMGEGNANVAHSSVTRGGGGGGGGFQGGVRVARGSGGGGLGASGRLGGGGR